MIWEVSGGGGKMVTNLGEIEILVNGKEVQYDCIELNNQGYCFKVEKRFKLVCNIPKEYENNIDIRCAVKIRDNIQAESGSETGENLALLSWYWGNCKLSIGTKGDLKGIKYIYEKNALRLIMAQNSGQVIFYTAWIDKSKPEQEDICTWFAADPAYDE